jgi:hypothetical protein
MVSNTRQTFNRRLARKKRAGKVRKRLMRRLGTPEFPIHPEGYDPKAADAKGAAQPEGD